MVANFARIGIERQVNLSPNVDINQLSSDVAAMSDGRFFVAYADDGGGATGTDIIGQFVNADGTLAQHSFGNDGPVSATGNQVDPTVALRTDGAALVAWTDKSTGDIRLTTIGSDGKNQIRLGTVGANIGVGDGTHNSHPDAATFASGDSIIVWEDAFGGSTSDHDIHAKILTSVGSLASTLLVIDSGGSSFSEAPAVAASGSKALVAFADARDGNNADIRISLVDSSGTGSATPSVVIANKTGDLGHVDVAALSDGRYIVVYEDTSNNDIYARFVNASGNAVGAELVIAKTSAIEESPKSRRFRGEASSSPGTSNRAAA